MPLDRGAERLLRILAASGRCGGPPTTADRRQLLEALAQQADAAPSAEVRTRELDLRGPAARLRARLYASPDATDAGLVFFHGGGWVAGSLVTHDGLCRRLAASSGGGCGFWPWNTGWRRSIRSRPPSRTPGRP